jgi:hypothetical protein
MQAKPKLSTHPKLHLLVSKTPEEKSSYTSQTISADMKLVRTIIENSPINSDLFIRKSMEGLFKDCYCKENLLTSNPAKDYGLERNCFRRKLRR